MLQQATQTEFPSLNRGYNSVFKNGKLSVGLVVPIENYASRRAPTMEGQSERIQFAEQLGFTAVWLRDVPFDVPSFGDAGQLYDPFVYLGLLAGQTKRIALGVSSIVLPLRHPAHVAKAAASVDALSDGRLILGIASGDRPEEYPALDLPFEERGKRFRESYEYIRQMSATAPVFENDFGTQDGGMDMLPKPTSGQLPLLITGGSQQSPEWTARNGDGWMIYPRNLALQKKIVEDWHERVDTAGGTPKPIMQPLYIDLTEDPDFKPEPIHLGLRLGANHLEAYLQAIQEMGMNHVALNLRFNQSSIEQTLERLATRILPNFTNS